MSIAVSRETANPGFDHPVGGSRPIGRSIDALRDLFHALWPAKSSLQYAAVTGVCQRTAERVIAGERPPSADALIALLRGPDGAQVLGTIMDGCTEQHWRDYRRGLTIGRALRQTKAAQREVERLIESSAD